MLIVIKNFKDKFEIFDGKQKHSETGLNRLLRWQDDIINGRIPRHPNEYLGIEARLYKDTLIVKVISHGKTGKPESFNMPEIQKYVEAITLAKQYKAFYHEIGMYYMFKQSDVIEVLNSNFERLADITVSGLSDILSIRRDLEERSPEETQHFGDLCDDKYRTIIKSVKEMEKLKFIHIENETIPTFLCRNSYSYTIERYNGSSNSDSIVFTEREVPLFLSLIENN